MSAPPSDSSPKDPIFGGKHDPDGPPFPLGKPSIFDDEPSPLASALASERRESLEEIYERKSSPRLVMTKGLWGLIIVALTVSGTALFIGGVLTGSMLTGPDPESRPAYAQPGALSPNARPQQPPLAGAEERPAYSMPRTAPGTAQSPALGTPPASAEPSPPDQVQSLAQSPEQPSEQSQAPYPAPLTAGQADALVGSSAPPPAPPMPDSAGLDQMASRDLPQRSTPPQDSVAAPDAPATEGTPPTATDSQPTDAPSAGAESAVSGLTVRPEAKPPVPPSPTELAEAEAKAKAEAAEAQAAALAAAEAAREAVEKAAADAIQAEAEAAAAAAPQPGTSEADQSPLNLLPPAMDSANSSRPMAEALPPPTVVVPETPSTTTATTAATATPNTAQNTTTPADTDKRFAVQVGAFSQEDNATNRAESLRKLGFTPEIKPITMSSGRVLHVVLLGPYDSLRATANDRQTVRNAGMETAITPYPDTP